MNFSALFGANVYYFKKSGLLDYSRLPVIPESGFSQATTNKTQKQEERYCSSFLIFFSRALHKPVTIFCKLGIECRFSKA